MNPTQKLIKQAKVKARLYIRATTGGRAGAGNYLAAQLGIGPAALSHYATGRVNLISIHTAARLAKFLDMPLEDIAKQLRGE